MVYDWLFYIYLAYMHHFLYGYVPTWNSSCNWTDLKTSPDPQAVIESEIILIQYNIVYKTLLALHAQILFQNLKIMDFLKNNILLNI